ncbi:lytic transglycosylase domain-containing protein [Persicimonas caeni]|uniref:Lytic transglycosylase domain-containing protein n=1 Tax=Persicimonas caeni TaxID=2292766 RepID=A0A4Y6PLZ3_PERCE|nr:lytic transglycosylase domain-containing protein [Persicimonas caeni]QDG49270.1 lytic transglycosylase domain-containing protein [Persicimonas caeni]QED30491.1 lytic transglycosylase domain-containing protein [Persicimonas caeni]
MKLLRFVARVTKGIYDILATYLLAWVLFFALTAFGFHFGLEAAARALGFDSPDVWWRKLAGPLGETGVVWFRLLAFGSLHAAIVYFLRGPLGVIQEKLEAGFDRVADLFKYITRERGKLRVVGHIVFTLVVTLLLVPFVLQPTLVPQYTTGQAWLERGANLADGTASRFVADSVVGLYRKLYADPVEAEGGVSSAEVDAAQAAHDARPPLPDDPDGTDGPTTPPIPTGDQPLMDRWDDQIRGAAGGDPVKFAQIKAFMWVESAGRQFAVSHTGCSGLMQFCAGTARSRPYRKVFGVGRVYTCNCDGPCRIDRQTRRDIETGIANPGELADKFPCDLTDARFDAARSIRAGALYIDRLSKRFGGNLYLMYIGYNSGPAVAGEVYKRLGRSNTASLDEIELHLADAMRPHYGAGSERRARSLLRTHLPKIKRAYDRYYEPTTLAAK